MSWLFGDHSLWMDTLLRLGTAGSGLVVPHFDMADSVDSPREIFSFLRSGYEFGLGECGGKQKKGREEKVCKTNKKPV